MPHQRVPQQKAKTTAEEYRASLGKGHRPVAAASCVLGQKMMCQCRGPPWSPLEVKQKCGLPCPGRPSLPSRWNGTGPESKQDLSQSLPQAQTNLVWVMGFSVVLFVCLFGLEPMDTQHGVEWRSRGMDDVEQKRGEVRRRRWRVEGGDEDVWHTDLPLRWRETCREATGQSCSTNIHRPQDQGNQDRSPSLILQQMLFLTRIW